MDGVGAGENDPVEAAQRGQRGVKGAEGCRRREFDSRDDDGDRTGIFKQAGELRGLLPSARDEDAFANEGHKVPISFEATSGFVGAVAVCARPTSQRRGDEAPDS